MLTLSLPWTWVPAWLGRFHPVVLHFPIALILLVGLFELMMAMRPGRWMFPVKLILFLGASTAVVAATSGFLLMRAQAVEGDLVERHLWAGLAVAVLSVLTLALRLAPGWEADNARGRVYRGALAALCTVVVLAGHFGATLTHGEAYLTEPLPWGNAGAVVVSFPQDRPVQEWKLFNEVVVPILAVRCYECHRQNNFKGRLVLDNWAGLNRGGASGPLFVAGRPGDSVLMSRLLLPLDHEHHMPPRREPQPGETEIELLRRWVAAGAPAAGTLASLGADDVWLEQVRALPAALGDTTAPVEMAAEPAPEAIAALRADVAKPVEDLQRRYPGIVAYESRQSALIEINASLLGPAFGDADLAAMAPLRANVVRLDLTGTAVTDGGLQQLAGMDRLRVLRLNETATTDAGVRHLRTLEALESLSLFRTRITKAALNDLAALPNLKSWTAAETAATADAVANDSTRRRD